VLFRSVGHYGCGGVGAAFRCERVGLADNWLRHVQDVRERHEGCLCRLADDTARTARLCELNVIEQAANVCATTIVRDAWERGQALTVHGWIYGLSDGLLRDLNFTAGSTAEAAKNHAAAVGALN
jgi:carbonic anhydrase